MPTSGDWASVRTIIALAIVTYFTEPFTWDMLLIAAAMIIVFTMALEKLFPENIK